MSLSYYPMRFRLDNKDAYLIWHTDWQRDHSDGVVVNEAGSAAIFRNRANLIAYAEAHELPLAEDEPAIYYNLDVVLRWMRRKRPAKLDCSEFLHAWNLLSDISASIGGGFDADKSETNSIYDKLFWGCNLPAMTPPGRCYAPIWRGQESRAIRRVLGAGLLMLRSQISAPPKTVSAELP